MKFEEIIIKYVPDDFFNKTSSSPTTRYVSITEYPIKELKGVELERKLTGYEKIENSYLYGQYLLRIYEYIKNGIDFTEETLFHLTYVLPSENIVKTNFDYRKTERSRYGEGVSFAKKPWYARTIRNYYVDHFPKLIVAKVLIGNKDAGNYDTLPEEGYDTTTCGNKKVFVKYFDNEYYPFALFNVPDRRHFSQH